MGTEDFKEMLEANLNQSQLPEAGQFITTTVIQVTDKDVVLDIGAKSESRIELSEFETAPNIGDEIEVYVEKSGANYVKVSFKRALEQQAYDKIRDSLNNGSVVKGKPVEVIKGGFKVMLEGQIQAFMPLSHVDIKRVEKPEIYLNKMYDLKVINFEKKGRNLNIVVSRKPILEVEKAEKIGELYKKLDTGLEVDCTVIKINPKSVIVELEDSVTGLIRIGDLSWDRVEQTSDVVKVGQQVKAKIIDVDKAENRILLSIKDMKKNPWDYFMESHQLGDVVKGEVVKAGNRQVFVRIEEGVEGLIRFEDLSWSRSLKKPTDVVAENTVVEAKIIGFEDKKKKVLLGLKQIMPDPWDDIDSKYPIGKKVTGKVTGKTEFGVFVEIESGVEALLHKNDIDWQTSKVDLDKYNLGDEIEGIIIKLNKPERRVSMGIKQLFDNPWQNFASEYPKNSRVKGIIKEIQENIIIMSFGEEIEGVLPKNHLNRDQEGGEQRIEPGQELEVMITEINPSKNMLRVSVKEMFRKEKEKELAKYMTAQEEEGNTEMTFGDVMGKNLDKLKNKFSQK